MQKILGDDSDESDNEKITVRSDEIQKRLDVDRDPQLESRQGSDIPTSRESTLRRPPVRSGRNEFINKK